MLKFTIEEIEEEEEERGAEVYGYDEDEDDYPELDEMEEVFCPTCGTFLGVCEAYGPERIGFYCPRCEGMLSREVD